MRGTVITPDDPGYDEARAVYNAMIDKRPAIIVQCVDVADVMQGVTFAGANDLPICVRGGGHNAAGLGTCDDGLVIDLGRMNAVHVNPNTRRVLVEGGAVWGDVDHATQPFGLAVPCGIVSTTGVGGLTLGGGFGYLSRKHGLTIDNLVSADLVLADGSFVTVSETEHPDLFWAIRGGGGNFGVVTAFEFQAHPVSTVTAGVLFYRARQGRGADEALPHLHRQRSPRARHLLRVPDDPARALPAGGAASEEHGQDGLLLRWPGSRGAQDHRAIPEHWPGGRGRRRDAVCHVERHVRRRSSRQDGRTTGRPTT